jgi:hypothetical protein
LGERGGGEGDGDDIGEDVFEYNVDGDNVANAVIFPEDRL